MNLRTLGRIAWAVFRDSVRDRVLYNLVGFALLVIGASFLIGQLTAGQDVKIIKDLGLAAMAVFGLFIAIFIGIGLVSKEVERRSIYSLIAKPVRRSELVVGKYLGLVLTIVINVAVMTAVWYGVLGYMSWMESAEAFRQAWEARHRSAHARRGVSDRRAADAGDGHRAVLLHVLEPDAVGRVRLRAVRRRPFQRRPEELRRGRRRLARAVRDHRSVLPAAEHGDLRREKRRRARTASSAGLPGHDDAYGLSYIVALVAAGAWIFSRRDFK